MQTTLLRHGGSYERVEARKEHVAKDSYSL